MVHVGINCTNSNNNHNSSSRKNSIKSSNSFQHQKQRVYLLDEQQQQGSSPPVRPCRVWRPPERRQWPMEMTKRRQRIVRIFMVVGTVALGIGLLLLLWIGLMLEGKQPKKNGGTAMRPMEAEEGEKEIVPTNLTMDSAQKAKVQTNESDAILRLPNFLLENSNSNASSGKEATPTSMTPTTTPTATSRPQQKLRLSIIQEGQNQRQRMHPYGKANKGASQRIGPPRQVQLTTQRARPHNPQQLNVIRVTAPANHTESSIQFDRMQMKHEDRERSRVLAKWDRPGQWGILTGIQEGPKTTDERKTATTTTTTKVPGGHNARKVKAEINADNGSKNSSEESGRRQEEGEDDDLFWMRPSYGGSRSSSGGNGNVTNGDGGMNYEGMEEEQRGKNEEGRQPEQSTTARSLMNQMEEEKSPMATLTTKTMPFNEGSNNGSGASSPPILAIPATTTAATTTATTTTDGYQSKRPTIEFGPVRAESEADDSAATESQTPTNKAEEAEDARTGGLGWTTMIMATSSTEVEEELNEIIESVEREPQQPPSTRPTAFSRGGGGGERHPHRPQYPLPPPDSLEDEIHPVEIPFDPFVSSIPASEIPIWRRPPPEEESSTEFWSNAPPAPPLKPLNFALNAKVEPEKQKKNSKELLKERQLLRRRRREAPVLVTALMDIGRGQWQRFTRHFDQYLGYLTNILMRLQNNVVLFCDPSVVAYLRALGPTKFDWEKIQIVEVSLPELPFYKFRPEIEEIMRWEQENWQRDWDQQMRAHPETLYPDYDILVNSKPYFLYNATQISRFPRPIGQSEQFFAWLDAGYGHGSSAAIPNGIWEPRLRAGQITLVKLPTLVERVERYTLDKVYRKQRSIVSGGFLAGDDRVIRRFWTFFTKTFMELLDQRKVDDDQTTLLVTIQRYNSTFNLLQGGWFDAFKLLSSSSSSSQLKNQSYG